MLEQINTMITDLLGPAGPLMIVAGLAFLLIFATIPMLLSAKPDPMDKLKKSNRDRMDAEKRAVLRDKSKNDKLYLQVFTPTPYSLDVRGYHPRYQSRRSRTTGQLGT